MKCSICKEIVHYTEGVSVNTDELKGYARYHKTCFDDMYNVWTDDDIGEGKISDAVFIVNKAIVEGDVEGDEESSKQDILKAWKLLMAVALTSETERGV